MTGRKKQVISVRLEEADIRRNKVVAARLRVSESEVIRFALRQLFKRLASLHSGAARGAGLLPLFLDNGSELIEHFNIDVTQLEQILNDGADGSALNVDFEDVALLSTLAGIGALKPTDEGTALSGEDALRRLHEKGRAHLLLSAEPAAGGKSVNGEAKGSHG